MESGSAQEPTVASGQRSSSGEKEISNDSEYSCIAYYKQTFSINIAMCIGIPPPSKKLKTNTKSEAEGYGEAL